MKWRQHSATNKLNLNFAATRRKHHCKCNEETQMGKIYTSAAEALDGLLFDGMLIAAGGFGLCGIPENLF